MTINELRKLYIDFFISKGHKHISSASLVPENDPTVLFTTAGMHPLVPYLLGETHPEGRRLVSAQKCVRTVDIEDVGDNTHNTFFEMLGNWSLGDYFKKEAIEWSFEFLTSEKYLGITPQRIRVTVFAGDSDAPRDEEAIELWQQCFATLGIEAPVFDGKNAEVARIFPLPKADNWWGPAGETGPCGPDTEIFIDLYYGTDKQPKKEHVCCPGCKCGRYVEIWNNVFMEYNKTADGKYVFLSQKNVDTGMGLERTIAVLNGFDNVYECGVLAELIQIVKNNSTVSNVKSERIVVDHLRCAVFMLADGVQPTNTDRGYVLRRLIRRAVRNMSILKTSSESLVVIVEKIISVYQDEYNDLQLKKDFIITEIQSEEAKFQKTLEAGLKELQKKTQISGKEIFDIFQTFGFPLEMTIEELEKGGAVLNKKQLEQEFFAEFTKHQELSRTAAAGKFQGGLADNSQETTRLHTAAHLLLQSLKNILGEEVNQKGSNITAERLRFDFSYADKLTAVQKEMVEQMVNEQIQKKLPISFQEMSVDEARKMGATGVFSAKYGERVKVYVIGNSQTGVFSREICGGPHVQNTGELGCFKIQKEESSSAGVRRIKAVLI